MPAQVQRPMNTAYSSNLPAALDLDEAISDLLRDYPTLSLGRLSAALVTAARCGNPYDSQATIVARAHARLESL